MTGSSMGIRGIAPFAAAAQGRKRSAGNGSERSLAKHANSADAADDTAPSPSLNPGHLIDIKV